MSMPLNLATNLTRETATISFSNTFTYTTTEPGIYKITCGNPGYYKAGMIAALVVEP